MIIPIPVSRTGIRSGESIAGPNNRSQTRGIIMKIRGFYQPNLDRVKLLTSLELRDTFNNIPFFDKMDENVRLNWLSDNATHLKDVYLEDTNIEVKFVRISGNNFFTKQLDSDTISKLLDGNPNDTEGYWPIRTIYDLFPRKPGSRARKHTLVFRPNNWGLFIQQKQVKSYQGWYLNLNDFSLKQGKVNEGQIYSYELEIPIALVVTKSRSTPLTEEHLFNLFQEYGDLGQMQKIKSIIKWFPPALHKSLIKKIIRTRAKYNTYNEDIYPHPKAL